VFWNRKRNEAPAPKPPPGQNPFEGLRQLALGSTPELAGWTTQPEGRRVYGGILDWALDRGMATLFALDDGTASLYLSTGGGVIGGKFHESVNRAAKEFVLGFEPFVGSMEPDVTGEPGPRGTTYLRALTSTGRLVLRASTDEFGNGHHPMSVVFHAGQALIHELRQVAEKGARR
jgi:hypothetical protein